MNQGPESFVKVILTKCFDLLLILCILDRVSPIRVPIHTPFVNVPPRVDLEN